MRSRNPCTLFDSIVTHLYDNLAKSTIRKMGRVDLKSVVKSTMATLIRTHSPGNGSTSDFQIYCSEMREVNSRVKLSSTRDLLCIIPIFIIITTNFINIPIISHHQINRDHGFSGRRAVQDLLLRLPRLRHGQVGRVRLLFLQRGHFDNVDITLKIPCCSACSST